jgi:hypothetical protein
MKQAVTVIAILAMTSSSALADLKLIKGRLYKRGDYTDQVFVLKNETRVQSGTSLLGAACSRTRSLSIAVTWIMKMCVQVAKVMTELARLEGGTLRVSIVRLNQSSRRGPEACCHHDPSPVVHR